MESNPLPIWIPGQEYPVLDLKFDRMADSIVNLMMEIINADGKIPVDSLAFISHGKVVGRVMNILCLPKKDIG